MPESLATHVAGRKARHKTQPKEGFTVSTGHITALVTGANRGLGKHFASYAAAKAAEWAMTDTLKQELAPRGIHVTAVHVGYIDTDMAAFVPADQKTDPAAVARLALDGRRAGEPEVLADDLTRATKAQLSGSQDDR